MSILYETPYMDAKNKFYDSIRTFSDINSDDKIWKFISYLGSEGYNSDDDAFDDLKSRVSEYRKLPNPVTLYRIVGVVDGDVIDKNELGSHWTISTDYYDSNFLELIGTDRWDSDTVPYMITAKVPHSKIDIGETIYHNLTYPRENEIFVKDSGRGLNIVNIKRWEFK